MCYSAASWIGALDSVPSLMTLLHNQARSRHQINVYGPVDRGDLLVVWRQHCEFDGVLGRGATGVKASQERNDRCDFRRIRVPRFTNSRTNLSGALVSRSPW